MYTEFPENLWGMGETQENASRYPYIRETSGQPGKTGKQTSERMGEQADRRLSFFMSRGAERTESAAVREGGRKTRAGVSTTLHRGASVLRTPLTRRRFTLVRSTSPSSLRTTVRSVARCASVNPRAVWRYALWHGNVRSGAVTHVHRVRPQ